MPTETRLHNLKKMVWECSIQIVEWLSKKIEMEEKQTEEGKKQSKNG